MCFPPFSFVFSSFVFLLRAFGWLVFLLIGFGGNRTHNFNLSSLRLFTKESSFCSFQSPLLFTSNNCCLWWSILKTPQTGLLLEQSLIIKKFNQLNKNIYRGYSKRLWWESNPQNVMPPHT